ncbi:MAG: alpha/beta fold hydrolase [Gammaproteobacteria bacterium]|nr:alpha/beta fold hydrolase [Gammaproteobacteria bacterium]
MIKLHAPTQHNAALPDLVLLHGWCMSSRIWDQLLPRLRDCCNPWCVDLPNHGDSPAGPWPPQPSLIVDAIAATVPADAVWLGWSVAGLLILEAAATCDLRGLILLAANPKFVRTSHWPGMPEADFSEFRQRFIADPETALTGFQKLQFGQRALSSQAQQTLQTALTHPDTERLPGLQQALAFLHAGDARHRLGQIDCPALILGGTGDRLIPAEALSQTASMLPQSSLTLLPEVGHALMLEQPAAVSEAICGFAHAL